MRTIIIFRVSLAVLISLLLVFALPTAALADEGTPPPTEQPAETEEDAPPPTEELAATPEPTQEVVPTEEIAEATLDTDIVDVMPTEEAAPTEAMAEDGAILSDETSEMADLLAIPEGTELIVLDETGELLPLASEEAAEILTAADPMWCPTGATPGAVSCSASFPSLSALVAGFVPTGNGVIWIQAGNDSGGDVSINGAGTWAAATFFSLTLNGGWSGLNNTVTDPTNPSVFDTHISIFNWNGDVTLNDIEIYNTAGGAQALWVSTSKNIVLNRVHVHNNTGAGEDGARLETGGTGNVTINSSEFTSNQDTNLQVSSYGTITLSNVIASDSVAGHGAYLVNSSVTGKAVTVTGTNAFDSVNLPSGYQPNDFFNSFNDNFGVGLVVYSKGAITLSNLTASENNSYGAFLFNNYTGISAGATLNGTNYFNDNGDDGLAIDSRGPVKVNSISANSNGASGVNVVNSTAITAQPVTFTGTNEFKFNSQSGLHIRSNGVITLNNLLAYRNFGTTDVAGDHRGGAYLDNSEGSYASGITLTGANESSDNSGHGFYIESNGTVSLANITANGNGNGSGNGYALYVDNSTGTLKSVTISGTSSMDNNRRGLYIYSRGAITANNLTVTNTDGSGAFNDGAHFDNAYSGSTGGVTLTGTNEFSNNSDGTGLYVSSYGAISLSKVTASYNGNNVTHSSGLYLDNHLSPLATFPGVTLTGVNAANGNGIDGVTILTTGAVSISSLTAGQNGITNGNGLSIDNHFGPKAVSLTGTNYFEDNYSDGLYVLSKGAISLSNVTASWNGNLSSHNGVTLDNLGSGSTSPQNVTVSGSNVFSWNEGDGLNIQTFGAITLNNVTADHSIQGSGVLVDNSTGTLARNITLTGSNWFNNNHVNGLRVDSRGVISASNLTANYNATGSGAWLTNSLGSADVILSGTNRFDSNYQGLGLYVLSHGAIKINNLNAGYNGNGSTDYGAHLENSGAGSPKAVTLTGNNDTSSNYDSGLYIQSIGMVSLNNLVSNTSSHGLGLEISNAFATAGVTQTGYLKAYNNYGGGFYISSKGPITLNNLRATDHTGFAGAIGAQIDNTASTPVSPQNVTINGTNTFNYNSAEGLMIDSYGAITLSKVTANDSLTSSGAVLDNCQDIGFGCTATVPKSVTITGTSTVYNQFHYNQINGLVVKSLGLITASYVDASSNDTGVGASLDNCIDWGGCTATTSSGVTLSGTNYFNYNSHDTGLEILSRGAITISNLNAEDNGDSLDEYGASLDNSGATSPKPVTLTGTNKLRYNEDSGLYIKTAGFVTLNQVTADSNGTTVFSGYGLEISNMPVPTGVKLTGVNQFNYNYEGGITATVSGPITLNSIEASSSAGPGAFGAWLKNTASLNTNPQNVTLTGTNNFNSNPAGGLSISTFGAIALSNVTASGASSGFGANLDNFSGADPTKPRNITFTGTNTFSSNGLDGLYVLSSGHITANGLIARYNNGDGAWLQATGNVILGGTNVFYGNTTGRGLTVSSTSGLITINNLDASNNGNGGGDYGAYLVNSSGTQPISLTGTNTFYYNYDSGLFIRSKGAITLANLTVQGNNQATLLNHYGADIYNAYGGATAGVTLTGTHTISSNRDRGLQIETNGAITLGNITATHNWNVGVYLANHVDGKNVTLSGTNNFMYNSNAGLVVYSHGAITVNNVTAINNDTVAAVQLDNTSSTMVTKPGVSLTGINNISQNYNGGLDVKSKGAITVNSITAWRNYSGTGVKLDNSLGTAAVTLTGTNKFIDNSGKGLEIISAGNVTLAKIRADDNSTNGVDITTTGTVTFNCGSIVGNGNIGLRVVNASTITLKGVLSAGNTPNEDLNPLAAVIRVRTCP